jgi:uncharacterized Zn finger protein (UPF0148 family)
MNKDFYIPDPIERAEAAALAAFDRLSLGGTMMKCPECGTPFDFEKEGGMISPNLAALPVCGNCVATFMHEDDDDECPSAGNYWDK